ncbi:MAG: preprotein translocase subunit YajC [Peptococcaceae bacterium]|nr:preprotein translocase subunit YajC [Peptococcaceae bacterium]
MSSIGWIIYVVAILAFLYVLMIRPQKKIQSQRSQMLANLKINDRVLTAGGITGYIRELSDSYVYVEIAEGLVVEVSKQYVAQVLQDEENDDAYDDADDVEEAEAETADPAEVEEVTEEAEAPAEAVEEEKDKA